MLPYTWAVGLGKIMSRPRRGVANSGFRGYPREKTWNYGQAMGLGKIPRLPAGGEELERVHEFWV